jgi:hypothetical protein
MVSATETAIPVKKRASEQAYAMDALKRLRRLGVKCRREAAILGRSADLVFLREGKVCSVEMKLHDWKRALTQARDHKLAMDRAYICLPGKAVTPAMRAQAESMGVGLLLYSDTDAWPFQVALDAPAAPVLSPNVRERVLKSLR